MLKDLLKKSEEFSAERPGWGIAVFLLLQIVGMLTSYAYGMKIADAFLIPALEALESVEEV